MVTRVLGAMLVRTRSIRKMEQRAHATQPPVPGDLVAAYAAGEAARYYSEWRAPGEGPSLARITVRATDGGLIADDGYGARMSIAKHALEIGKEAMRMKAFEAFGGKYPGSTQRAHEVAQAALSEWAA